ncbi:MAG: MBL fold metallo-hydrolase [Chloroflexi bacterium]|nr:MBL fold metallo-hydrolase [Chloroflexota bacterium]
MAQPAISVEALQGLLAHSQPVTVLDIRRADERAEWSIPGSMHVDVYDALNANRPNALATLNLPTDRPVVTICGAGKTSLLAAEQLRARGFDAHSLTGGMKGWSLAWNQAEVALPGSKARVVQVRRTGKGCLSYLIGADRTAAVVDPALEPDVYLGLARQNGWTITHIFETHVHADHLSRGRVLAERSGATHHLPEQKRVVYPFAPIQDGQEIGIGPARLAALRTPGHTPESTCYLLDGQALFTGDTLFLAGVGRPDLEATPDEARRRAHLLYRSLWRLLALPAQTIVLPGHASEPIAFDGVALAGPLAQVKAQVALLHMPEERFVESILARIPATPPNHQRIVEFNEAGLLPQGDLTDWEAGANRCAIA